MTPDFTPLYDHLLVKKDEEQTTLAGGILLPDHAADKPDRGIILAAGHGRLLESGQVVPMLVKPGDRVVFHKFCGTEIKLDNQTYLILQESDLYGILPEAKTSAA